MRSVLRVRLQQSVAISQGDPQRLLILRNLRGDRFSAQRYLLTKLQTFQIQHIHGPGVRAQNERAAGSWSRQHERRSGSKRNILELLKTAEIHYREVLPGLIGDERISLIARAPLSTARGEGHCRERTGGLYPFASGHARSLLLYWPDSVFMKSACLLFYSV